MNVVSDLDAGFRLEEWEVHPDQNRLAGPAGEIHLTPRGMDILVLLAERAGQVVHRDEFSERIWQPAVVTDDALTRHISSLRQSLGDDTGQPRFIETIPKRGYRLVARVAPLESASVPTQDRETSVSTDDVDSRKMKGSPMRRPALLIALAVVLGLGAIWMNVTRESGPEASPSIAVLPFEAFGTDAESPLIDGLHHDLLTRLSHIDDLRVISRTSVKRYRDTLLPIKDIAAELGVAWIVEGAVQQVGNEIQLNAQLIDGKTDSHIWARTYRREMTAENLFAIQADLVEDIASSLETSLTPAEESQVGAVPTENLDSYTLYVQGRTFMEARTEDGIEQALVFFREAVEQDAGYALAWVGLADALALLHDYGYRDAEDVLPEAERAIERALTLNPDLAEAHASRGLLHSTRREGPEALRALNEATALRPGYAEAHNWLSWNYQVLGFASEALASAEKAVSLNPFSVEALANLTAALIANEQYEAALKQARHLDALPLPFIDNFNKGLALYHAGMFREAIETLEPMRVAWVDGGLKVVRALAHIALNEEQQAEALLEELHELGDHFSTGLVLAALGDLEAAFTEFERIEQWHYWSALALNHYHPLIEPIRSDPRFDDMLGDMREHYGLLRDGSLPSQ